ncbi:MAG: tryptophan synthase subunit alpha [Oscillospiraceae bacterium]|nr:tryptophan synthase subunit alpha [Oscillospiraceae bacterium]
MNRIENAFKNKKAFIGFLTAGDPTFDSSFENIMAAIKAGADMIEIGIPFSDPIAEGVVIQGADLRALQAGMTTDLAFELAQKVRRETDIPLVFMTYLNPVFKYGYDRFFARCKEIGVDGLICPDMPFEEKSEADEIAKKHGISIISMIAPTSEARIKSIAESADGFLYIVSSMGVTGVRSEIKTDLASIMESVKKYKKVPAAIGFGVSTPEQAEKMAALSDGVIVGSAIVRIVEKYGEKAAPEIYNYVKSMTDAVHKI